MITGKTSLQMKMNTQWEHNSQPRKNLTRKRKRGGKKGNIVIKLKCNKSKGLS